MKKQHCKQTHRPTCTHSHIVLTQERKRGKKSARIMLDIIFYLLLILFTSRCQFEWQVAEHFRVCLLAFHVRLSEFDCDPLILQERGCSQVARCCLPVLKVLCVCRAREWGREKKIKKREREGGLQGRGWGGVGSWWTSPSPGVWRILHHFISKMEMSRLGTSPQQLESGPVVYLFHSVYKQQASLLHINCCCCDFVFDFSWFSFSVSLYPFLSLLPSSLPPSLSYKHCGAPDNRSGLIGMSGSTAGWCTMQGSSGKGREDGVFGAPAGRGKSVGKEPARTG